MKIVERRLSRLKGSRRKLASTRIVSAQGKRITAPIVNTDSQSLGQDLLESFSVSVDRARRDNKALFGNRDRVDDD